jgi:predicted transcriptional regulator
MKKIPQSNIDYLRANHKTKTVKELAIGISRENSTVRRNLEKLGLKAKKYIIEKKPLTAEEIEYVKKNIINNIIKQIADDLGRSSTTIGHEVKKPEYREIIVKKKQDSYYKKGNISYNKGKKQSEYMSAEAIERCKKGQYKKGNQPHNTLPDYKEVIRKDKSGKEYVMIKLPGQKLQLKQRYIYQTHIGIIPENHKVCFRDRNTQNFDLSNLELISNNDLMRKNSLHNYPKEITELIHLKGVLKRQINKKNNN